MRKFLIDDGFRPELVESARFDGFSEIPIVEKPTDIVIPEGLVPFSNRKRDLEHKNFVCFYEHDVRFRDCIVNPEKYVEELRQFPGIVSPDCSLYIDMPLCLQVNNAYLNRGIGRFFQSQGLYVIPNVCWGDERTYTTVEMNEKVAFLGAPKHSIVSVGTYGCVKNGEDKRYFREGLIAMLDELEPEVVLVYGAMPKQIFSGLESRTRFVKYPDWISYKKGGKKNGND